jgi:hypothetical protein
MELEQDSAYGARNDHRAKNFNTVHQTKNTGLVMSESHLLKDYRLKTRAKKGDVTGVDD